MIAFIDPFVLTCPDPEEHSRNFEAYIENVLLLFELREATWLELTIPRDSLVILFEAHLYPLNEKIRSAVERFGADRVQIRDIIAITDWALRNIPTVENKSGVTGVLFDKATTSPSNIFPSHPPHLLQCLYDMMSKIAIGMSIESKKIVITRFPTGCEFQFACEVHDCEMISLANFPPYVSAAFHAVSSKDDLVREVTPSWIWQNSTCPREYETALYHAVTEMGGGGLLWSFGSKFIASIKRYNFSSDPSKIKSLIRACVETILEVSLNDTHPLRVTVGGNSPQIIRGLEKAFRRDISYDFHLHYWQGPNGIEFSKMVIHDDFSIE